MIRLIVLLALVVSISAHAQTTITTVGNPPSLWAIAPGEKGSIDTAALKRLRAEGVNALVVDAQSAGAPRLLALHSLAKRMKMWLVVVVPQRPRTAAARRALALCKGHAANIRCAASAGSLARARTMAHKADSIRPFVALYASSPRAASQFEKLRWARRHIVVIAPLYKSFNSSIWGHAIGSAAISPAVDLAVAPVAGLSSSSVRRFGATLASGKTIAGTLPDVTPPSAPGVTLEGIAASSATVSWMPSVDDVGVAGYRVYVGGRLVQSTTATRTTVSGLTCAAVSIAVDAVDASGNASARSAVVATLAPCSIDPVGPALIPSSTSPLNPTGLAVSGVSPTTVMLSWSTSSDDPAVAGYRLYLDGTEVAVVSGDNYIFAGLTCGTAYTLGVAAYDVGGDSSGVSTASLSTLGCSEDSEPPSTPAGLTTSWIGPSSITLSWAPSSDNVGVSGYRLLRGGSQVATSSGTSFTFSGLSCGTPYALGVAADDAAGNVSATAARDVTTTPCPDTVAPSTPTGLTTSGVGQLSLTFSWSPSTDNVAVTGYRVFRGGVQVGTSTSPSLLLNGLTCGTSYTLGVAALDAAGNASATATMSATTAACPDTSAPSAPTGLTASGVGQTSAGLSWNASSDNVGVTGYRIFQNGAQIGTSISPTYLLGGLTCATTYTVGVAAVDAAGNVSTIATKTVTTTACPDTTAPSTPTGLVTSAVGGTSATLSWSASTDNVSVTGYRLYRGLSQVGSASGTTFTYSALTCGTSYALGVAAVDGAGNVSASATTNVTTAACPDTTAPSMPTGLTASAVGQSSATLSWTASSDNVAVTGYRVLRAGTQVGATSSTTFTVTGMLCGTPYTLGVAALDAAGNVSAIATTTVTTTACPDTLAPSTPTGLATSAVGQTSATLSWSASSDNVGVVGYRLFRGGSQVGTASGTTFTYSGLACGTSYVLGVAAIDAAGNASATATTGVTSAACPDTVAPSTPTGLGTSAVAQSSATLSWVASSDNVAVTGYRVFRDGTQVGTTASTSFTVTSMVCATTYTLGVAALDAAGNVSATATKAVTTTACPDTSAPSVPTGLATSAVGQTSATLSWTPSSDNIGVTGYRLFRDGTQVGTAASTSFDYTVLSCGTPYVLGVASVDAAGNVSATATTSLTTAVCSDTSAPSTPTGLAAGSVGQTSAGLSWNASTDDVGVTGYRIYQNGSQIGTSLSLSYLLGGLTCATTYTVGIAAVDGSGNVSGIATLSVTTVACPDTFAPSTPTGLGTSAVAQTSATLSWAASSDNVGVTGYRLFRSGSQVGTATSTSFGYSGLTCGTSYVLGVAAVDSAGNVSATATTGLTTAACPDTLAPSMPTGLAASAVGQTSATLSWTASTDNVAVTGYRVFRAGTQVGTTSSTTFTVTGLTCATTYALGVAALDAASNVSATGTTSVSTPACPDTSAPSTPAGLATSAVSQTSATLSWSPATDNVGVTGYRVFRAGTQVGTLSATSFAFSGLTCGTSYTLGVAAADAAGNVSTTATKTVTTSACPDTAAPSTPTGLVTTSTGQTSVGLSWTASTDSVGVAGYRLLKNGGQDGTSLSTNYIFGGLACGTTYTFGVSAFDAAGNASAAASVAVATAACSGGGLSASSFVAQAASGSGDGSSCGNARSVAFFNTASNWGAGKPIAPGTVVGLCGTITSLLTFQGSGTSGNPITVLFMPNAKISLPTCSCFDASGSRSYITIDGGQNGVIEATDNGVGLGHRVATRAIDMEGCSNCTVQNLTISNIFVMSPQSSDPIDHTQSNAIFVDGANFTAKKNVIHDVGWAIYDNKGTNLRIEGNDISHMDHGISLSGSGAGPVFIAGNHIHDLGNWDCGGGCHHDGIHCYTVNGGNANHYGGGIYIYNNRFDGTIGSDNTSWLFLESNTGSGATPCADGSTNVYIFNNYAKPGDHQINNGVLTPASGKVFAYNNTMAGFAATNNGGYVWDCCAGNNGLGAFENNILSTANNFGGWTSSLFNPIDYNVYADAPGSASLRWSCNGSNTNTFSSFQASCGEAHGTFVSSANLNSSGVPQVGSAALNAAANLSSLCTGNLVPLCADITGRPRPTTGAWDAGAYEVSQ